MMNIMKYRLVTMPGIAMDILQSSYRHLWYLVPQTVVLALADQALAQLSPSLSFVFFTFSL